MYYLFSRQQTRHASKMQAREPDWPALLSLVKAQVVLRDPSTQVKNRLLEEIAELCLSQAWLDILGKWQQHTQKPAKVGATSKGRTCVTQENVAMRERVRVAKAWAEWAERRPGKIERGQSWWKRIGGNKKFLSVNLQGEPRQDSSIYLRQEPRRLGTGLLSTRDGSSFLRKGAEQVEKDNLWMENG